MYISTMNDMPGYRIVAVFGEVMGVTVRARDAGTQMAAGFRALGGGEVAPMTQLMYEARNEATGRMVSEAQSRGANAILALRYSATDVSQAWTELCAYGTAVAIEPIPAGQAGATPQSAAHAAGQNDRPVSDAPTDRPGPYPGPTPTDRM